MRALGFKSFPSSVCKTIHVRNEKNKQIIEISAFVSEVEQKKKRKIYKRYQQTVKQKKKLL